MSIPPELIVFAVSATPILELRVGIPLGLLSGMSVESSFFWAQLGNIFPIFFILKFLEPVSAFLIKHSAFFKRFFEKLFSLTRQKHSAKFEKLGELFLVTFIAIPLPGTGAWTGALLAFLFKIPYWKAILLILLGNIGAGVLVSLGFGGAIEAVKWLQPK